MRNTIPILSKENLRIASNYNRAFSDSDLWFLPNLNFSAREEFRPFRLSDPLEYADLDVSDLSATVDEIAKELLKLEQIDVYSTAPRDINKINNDYLSKLRERQEDFCAQLRRTDFEDGYDNEIIEEVEEYMRQNKSATINWIHELYAYYQNDSAIVTGLLRIIGSVVSKEDIATFIALIKCGLNDADVACQEAALMAIEVARTKECLIAIETATFHSRLIRRYAEKLSNSLRKELGYASANDR